MNQLSTTIPTIVIDKPPDGNVKNNLPLKVYILPIQLLRLTNKELAESVIFISEQQRT